MHAMILAAGHGERMLNLTHDKPKSLLEISGKPLIVYQIEALVLAGVKKIVINTGKFGNQIHDNLGDGKNFHVKIIYSDEGDSPLETAGGVARALPLLEEQTFILTNADIFTNFDYRMLFSTHDNCDAHIVLVDNPEHNKGRILITGPHKLTYSGIGCYHPRFFRKYMPRKNHYPLAPLLKQSAKDNNLGGQYFDGYWNDVGTPERLQEINNQHNRK